jgi:hypothetical protein
MEYPDQDPNNGHKSGSVMPKSGNLTPEFGTIPVALPQSRFF